MLYNVSYFNYIANSYVTVLVEAEDEAEAKVICWAADSPYIEPVRFNFEPEDYIVKRVYDNPDRTKTEAIERVGAEVFADAVKAAHLYEEE